MLNRVSGTEWSAAYEPAAVFDIEGVIAAVRRQFVLVMTVLGIFVALALLYIAVATRQYTASVDIFIDGKNLGASSNDQAEILFNSGAIDSQVELLKSERVIRPVIEKLKLTEDPDLASTSWIGSAVSSVKRLLSSGKGMSPEEERQRLVEAVSGRFESRLKVARVSKTFVLNISYTAGDPVRAAAIANAVADAYVSEQLEAKFEAGRAATDWLNKRIQEARNRSMLADLAVQQYRADNKLLAPGGRLLNEQQLIDLNSQLASTRSDRIKAQTKYERMQQILETRQVDAAVSETLNSTVMNELRTRYLTSAKRFAELSERLPPTHNQVVAAGREVKTFEDQIFAELSRYLESYRNEYEIARGRETGVQARLQELSGVSDAENKTQVQLRDLEREAEFQKAYIQSLVTKYQQLAQVESYPVTETRVISRAMPPLSASQPNVVIVLAMSVVLGLVVGSGLGLLSELRDATFRRSEQVTSLLGVRFLGILPLLAEPAMRLWTPAQKAAAVVGVPPLMQATNLEPLSRFSDILRSVRVAIDAGPRTNRAVVVGTISAFSGEGKSLVSSNLALSLGASGARVLLIDADLRRAGLSRAYPFGPDLGLSDVLGGSLPFKDALRPVGRTGVWFLGCDPNKPVADSSAVLASEPMAALVARASSVFDYIVVDLPPLGILVDAIAADKFIDQYLLVVSWGETHRDVVKDMLAHNPSVERKCLGALLNKASDVGLRRYLGERHKMYVYDKY